MNKERKMMKKPTFKSFYESVGMPPENQFDDTELKWIAEMIVREGFYNNFMDMVTNNCWLFRGSDEFRKVMNEQSAHLLKKRLAKRKSIYSKEQFVYNIWHNYSDLPSRGYAVFATFNKQNASMFGTEFVIIPKDATPLSGVKSDLNTSFMDVVSNEFGIRSNSFGDISLIFKIAMLVISGVKRYAPLKHRAKLEQRVDEIYDLWPSVSNVTDTTINEFDKWFAAFDDAITMFMTLDFDNEDVELKLSGRPEIAYFLKMLYKNYISKGKSSKDAILKVLKIVQKSIISTTDVSDMKNKMDATDTGNKHTSTSEIWWEGDSLLLNANFARPANSKKLLKYVQHAKNGK